MVIWAGAVFAAFLLGFFPMWLAARNYERERDRAVENLRPVELQNDLAAAAMLAQRGEFEQARQRASEFFTALRAEVDRETSALNRRRAAVEPVLARLDETITLLARSDAAAAADLADLYFSFRESSQPPAPAD
jgi:hypothetical protein